ncbi:hypothetical protein Tco_0988261 [Tanacetum coccineum]|uniref:Uncharacterized protein n=1 Tax=Tanacetum coccineum TaxID=301880 RepID=A0ABQ5EQN1_9ASTR
MSIAVSRYNMYAKDSLISLATLALSSPDDLLFKGRGLNLSFFKCFEPYPIRPRYDNAWAQAKRHLSFLFVGKVQKVIWTGKSQSSQGD